MSTTYSLVCDTCKKKYWAGQGDYLYKKKHVAKFLYDHSHHQIRFINDLADDEQSDQYTDINYELSETIK